MNNRNLIWFGLFLCISFVGLALFAPKTPPKANPNAPANCGSLVKVYTSNEVGPLSIRVLILRHSDEQLARDDGALVVNAVDRAKAKGLDIKIIGNHLTLNLGEIERRVKENIMTEANPGDTLIVHTIGHGSNGGTLQNIGQRKEVMRVLVENAQEHQQETLWWQLSCYAAKGLPDIQTVPGETQSLFSNIASSKPNELSYFGVQGKIMEKVFVAMAEHNPALDPDGDYVITAKELKGYINSLDSKQRGDLLFAQSAEEPIFGMLAPWVLPIVDRNSPQQQYPRTYIPGPRWR